MSRLALRRARVLHADGHDLRIEVEGEEVAAWADPHLAGPCLAGDELVVNVQARRLGLGSGGFDTVLVNLTRGLDGDGVPGAHVMALNYTGLQHAIEPVAPRAGSGAATVGLLATHGQLEAVLHALHATTEGLEVAYVQVAGGALPGALSRTVVAARADGRLAHHVTAGPCVGGTDGDAVNLWAAFEHLASAVDVLLVGPGPGILGSATATGHGGMAAFEAAHVAESFSLDTVVVPRLSDADPRERHQGLSHHTRTLLALLRRRVTVAWPDGFADDAAQRLDADHRTVTVDVDAYAAAGGSLTNMGRADRLFVAGALAGGTVLGAMAA